MSFSAAFASILSDTYEDSVLYKNIEKKVGYGNAGSVKDAMKAAPKTAYLESNIALTNGSNNPSEKPKVIPNLYQTIEDLSVLANDKSTADRCLHVNQQTMGVEGHYVDGIKAPSDNAKLITMTPEWNPYNENASGHEKQNVLFNIDADDIYFTISNPNGKIYGIPIVSFEVKKDDGDHTFNKYLYGLIDKGASKGAYDVYPYFVTIDSKYDGVLTRNSNGKYIVKHGTSGALLYYTERPPRSGAVYINRVDSVREDLIADSPGTLDLKAVVQARSGTPSIASTDYILENAYIIKTSNNNERLIITEDMLNNKGKAKLNALCGTASNTDTVEDMSVTYSGFDNDRWIGGVDNGTTYDYVTYGKTNLVYIRLQADGSNEASDFMYSLIDNPAKRWGHSIPLPAASEVIKNYAYANGVYTSIDYNNDRYDSVPMFRCDVSDLQIVIDGDHFVLRNGDSNVEVETRSAKGKLLNTNGWNNVKPTEIIKLNEPLRITTNTSIGDTGTGNVTEVISYTDITVMPADGDRTALFYTVDGFKEGDDRRTLVVPVKAMKPGIEVSIPRTVDRMIDGPSFTLNGTNVYDILNTEYGFHSPLLYVVDNDDNLNIIGVEAYDPEWTFLSSDINSIVEHTVEDAHKLHFPSNADGYTLIENGNIQYYNPPESNVEPMDVTFLQDMIVMQYMDTYFYIPSSCIKTNNAIGSTFGDTFKNIYDDYHHPRTVYKAIVINDTLMPMIFETMELPESSTAAASTLSFYDNGNVMIHANSTRPVYCDFVDDSGDRYQDYYSNPHTNIIKPTNDMIEISVHGGYYRIITSKTQDYSSVIVLPLNAVNVTSASDLRNNMISNVVKTDTSGQALVGLYEVQPDSSGRLVVRSIIEYADIRNLSDYEGMINDVNDPIDTPIYSPIDPATGNAKFLINDSANPLNTIDFYDPPAGPYANATPTNLPLIPYTVKQPYSLRAIIEAIQELNRRTVYMDGPGLNIFEANKVHDIEKAHPDAVHESTADGLPGLVHSFINTG